MVYDCNRPSSVFMSRPKDWLGDDGPAMIKQLATLAPHGQLELGRVLSEQSLQRDDVRIGV
jgi:hypothetical protein